MQLTLKSLQEFPPSLEDWYSDLLASVKQEVAHMGVSADTVQQVLKA